MPQRLERMVSHLMNASDFKPRAGRSKRSSAYAVATASLSKAKPGKKRSAHKRS